MIFPMNAPMFDLLVLSITEKADAYGYQLSQIIKQVSNTKDSTLYPVLKRLQEQGFLTVYDQSYQGRNRRYYRITEAGRRHFRMLSEEWRIYQEAVDQIVKTGGKTDEQR
ncbi:MAG: PadR family transcriptional regulator [Dorea sp.]|jgi:Predicted transcriptional regulators|nr:PadR family transcriptional regulator [Dorea sp.]MCI9614607.1 PadR family transcriptional regulator [Dorea sp.]MDE6938543.1 PadR family transcriptional regulator [Lachnospiraceae bacterium]MDE7037722.1 PadR family transcriptional regulator [Lachnospiraceae bacterium]